MHSNASVHACMRKHSTGVGKGQQAKRTNGNVCKQGNARKDKANEEQNMN